MTAPTPEGTYELNLHRHITTYLVPQAEADIEALANHIGYPYEAPDPYGTPACIRVGHAVFSDSWGSPAFAGEYVGVTSYGRAFRITADELTDGWVKVS